MCSNALGPGKINSETGKFNVWGDWKSESNGEIGWSDNYSNPLELKLFGGSVSIWARLIFSITNGDGIDLEENTNSSNENEQSTDDECLIKFDFKTKTYNKYPGVNVLDPSYGLDLSVQIYIDNPGSVTDSSNIIGFANIVNTYNFKWAENSVELTDYACAGASQPVAPYRCLVVFSTKDPANSKTGEFTFTILFSCEGMALREGHSGKVNGVDIENPENWWAIDVDPRIRAIGTNSNKDQNEGSAEDPS